VLFGGDFLCRPGTWDPTRFCDRGLIRVGTNIAQARLLQLANVDSFVPMSSLTLWVFWLPIIFARFNFFPRSISLFSIVHTVGKIEMLFELGRTDRMYSIGR
jgi:hypothetical protein